MTKPVARYVEKDGMVITDVLDWNERSTDFRDGVERLVRAILLKDVLRNGLFVIYDVTWKVWPEVRPAGVPWKRESEIANFVATDGDSFAYGNLGLVWELEERKKWWFLGLRIFKNITIDERADVIYAQDHFFVETEVASVDEIAKRVIDASEYSVSETRDNWRYAFRYYAINFLEHPFLLYYDAVARWLFKLLGM